MLEASQGKTTGQRVDRPALKTAFRFKNMIDLGMDVGIGDIPNIHVLDLLLVIHSEEMRLKKEKQKELEREAKQAGR